MTSYLFLLLHLVEESPNKQTGFHPYRKAPVSPCKIRFSAISEQIVTVPLTGSQFPNGSDLQACNAPESARDHTGAGIACTLEALNFGIYMKQVTLQP